MRNVGLVILSIAVIIGLLFAIKADNKKVKVPIETPGTPYFEDDDYDYTKLSLHESTYTPQKIKYIIFHCTGNKMKYPYTKQTLLDLFAIEFGWSKPGYRHFVDVNGVIWDLIDGYDYDEYLTYNEITYGARGYNAQSIHISYDGGYGGVDTRNPYQTQSLLFLYKKYSKLYPDAMVIPHYAVNSGKPCPSYNVYDEYNEYNANFELLITVPEPLYLEQFDTSSVRVN